MWRHLQMVRDKKLHDEIVEFVKQRHYSPEYAVSRVLRRFQEDGWLRVERRELELVDRKALEELAAPVLRD